MNTLTDVLDRVFVCAVGLLLTLAGMLSIGLYLNYPVAQRFVDLLQPHAWGTIPGHAWFLPAVAMAGIVLFFLAAWIIVGNFQRNRIRRVATVASNSAGAIEVDLSEVAAAVATSFKIVPGVIRTRDVVRRDHGQRVMIIKVDAEPSAPLRALIAHAEQSQKDISAALQDDSIALAFQLHFAPVERKTR
ncbi:hypothetical protein WG915_05230 [Corynebacterium sp. H128]|uniref:hypothetical protein n=1 Tax=unclassified Corynebacterium TaxID=2624378 RepID=UPI0030AB3423